jgi:hypothetical protein
VSKIYIASSWRNPYYLDLLAKLQEEGHECYDFRDPQGAFRWSAIDSEYQQNWGPENFRKVLQHKECFRGYHRDKSALDWCDTCILLLPCGRSAHLEAGYTIGRGKRTIIYLKRDLDGHFEPELMYKLTDELVHTDHELITRLRRRST